MSQVYFLIPGLTNLSLEDCALLQRQQFPHLEHFYHCSNESLSEQHSLDESLCQLNAINKLIFPLNAFVSEANQNTLIATPILLKTDINSTWAYPVEERDVMSDILFDMASFFEQDISIEQQIGQHYIIRFKNIAALTSLPHYVSILGKKINPYTDLIKQHLDWFKLFNEMQMYLHAHPKNQLQNGQQYFNSLWFWGGDDSHQHELNYQIHSDDDLFNNLDTQSNSKDKLFVLLDLMKHLKQNRTIDLVSFFQNIDDQLAQTDLNQVVIDDAHGHRWHYSAFNKLKFWNKSKPLHQVFKAQIVNAQAMNQQVHD